jgi:hypothetical protein
MKRILVFAILFGLSAPAAVSAWIPPVGIPAPPWPADLDIARPTLPNPWTSDQAGFYYINPQTGSDSGRAYGNPNAPRATLPSSPAAGSVICMAGTFAGSKTISYTGTASQPIWLMAYSPASKPTIAAEWALSGSYLIVDSLSWSWNARDAIGLSGHHNMMRDCVFDNPYDSATGAVISGGGSFNVFYRNTMPRSGNWQYSGSADIDRHGIKVSGSDLWIVDSTFYHIHGDAVQVGDQNNASSAINRIYIGRNTTYENYQSGFWTKNATDVIFSQNTVYNMMTSSSFSPGMAMGGQYDPKYVWYLMNRVYNSNSGIHVAGASSGGGGPWYMIGNVLSNIDSNGGGNYGGGALGNRNSGAVTIIFNTVYDADIFVSEAPGPSSFIVRNNIFSTLKSGGEAFALEGVAVTHDYNLYSSSAYDPGGEAHRVVGDPKFNSPTSRDFTLQAASPALNAASPTEEAAFALFQSRYGLDIRKDIVGVVRPQSTRWDIGAYEGSGGSAGGPLAPTNVRVIK